MFSKYGFLKNASMQWLSNRKTLPNKTSKPFISLQTGTTVPTTQMGFYQSMNKKNSTHLSGITRNFSSSIKKDGKDNNFSLKLFNLKLFNLKNPFHIEKLAAIFKAEVEQVNEKDKLQHIADSLMITWLRTYVLNAELLKRYDNYSLQLIAEATFWSVKLGLAPLLAKMNYAEIREFQPLTEYVLATNQTERSRLIRDVSYKLTKPTISFEASYAIQQAAWCIYVHHHSYEKLREEEKSYDSKKTLTP